MRDEPLEVLLRQALELLGYRVSCVAPDLLKAEPADMPAAKRLGEREDRGGRQASWLIACSPVWLARAPGIVLAAPGSEPARRIWRAVARRGRTATLVAASPGHAGPLRRSLWFRFLLTVRGFALVEGARRFVIDVWATGEPEQACRLTPEHARGWCAVHTPSPPAGRLAALGWVSPYEVRQLGQAALEVAAEAGRERVAMLRQDLDLLRQAERRRVQQYFDERRSEEAAHLGRLLRRAVAAALYARLAADGELARRLQERAGRLAALVRLQHGASATRLSALERERAAALAEIDDRYALQARLTPAGMAVVWHPPGDPPLPG